MCRILLTSNGFGTEQIKQKFLMLLPKPASAIKAVIITTASPEKEASKSAVKAKQDLIEMGVVHVTFFDFEYESPKALGSYDAVFLNGGNPFQLLYWLKKSGGSEIMNELAQQKTVFVGASAGAMVLGGSIEVAGFFKPELNTLKLADFNALGLTEKLLFPHYDREDLFPDGIGRTIEQRIKRFELDKNETVVRLKDHEYLSIN
ncbi:peptidase E [Planococcus antarcticus DSM 14505]|uniref:Peptidase E n=1 Tax=Planococcus antarcticus DSM 14505 TaxID=1185653 RepID=A0A1C7DHH6_9BACL|nr:Type 1 glutamine amidotransferase-like domain-containing protein [Planococcus antarcticus]ANU10956.1 peptidase E [Planococcus antarcticus DSM 14505]EIM07125.1 peptidase E [Planococcus antarcticus DSM 14505]